MANLGGCGWETGDSLEMVAATGTTSVQGTTVRTGSYALEVNPSGAAAGSHLLSGTSAAGAAGAASINIATAWYGVYFRYATKPATNDEECIVIRDTNNASDKFSVRLNSAGKLVAYDSALALLGTGTTVLSSGTWYRIEIKCGTGASAAWEVKIDGVSVLSGSTANLTVNNNGSLRLGKPTNRNSNTIDFFYDDAVIDDAGYVGAQQTVVLVPNANGTYQTFSIGAGSGSHFQIVDEIPNNGDTDYLLSDGVIGDAETEAFTDTATAGISGTIQHVKIIAIVKRHSGTTNGTVTVRARSGSTDSDNGSTSSSTASYLARMRFLATDPATGSAWTTSGVDGLEGGIVEGQTGASNTTHLSAVYAMVCYTPSGGSNTTITPTVGALVLAGIASLLGLGTIPSVGALTLNGIASTLTQQFVRQPVVGSLLFNGIAPTLTTPLTLQPGVGTLTLNGIAPTVSTPVSLQPGVGTLTFNGVASSLSLSTIPGVGSLLFAGVASKLNAGIIPTVGTLSISGYASLTNWTLIPGVGTLTFNGVSSNLSYVLKPNVGSLAFNGLTSTLRIAIVPSTGQLVLVGIAPTVTGPPSAASQYRVLDHRLLMYYLRATDPPIFVDPTDAVFTNDGGSSVDLTNDGATSAVITNGPNDE